MKGKLCFVFDLLGMMYAVMLNCRMHFISSGKKWVPIETWSNKKAEKNRDGLCAKTHHRSPQTPKAGKGWEWKKTEMGVAQTHHRITANTQGWDSKKTEMGGAQTHHQITTNTQGWDSKKTEMGGAGMHLAITTPTALFGTKKRVVVPIEEEMKEGGLHQTSFPAQKRRRGRRKKERGN
jgi:hypothetical protein